jgi:hypothetical protein
LESRIEVTGGRKARRKKTRWKILSDEIFFLKNLKGKEKPVCTAWQRRRAAACEAE